MKGSWYIRDVASTSARRAGFPGPSQIQAGFMLGLAVWPEILFGDAALFRSLGQNGLSLCQRWICNPRAQSSEYLQPDIIRLSIPRFSEHHLHPACLQKP